MRKRSSPIEEDLDEDSADASSEDADEEQTPQAVENSYNLYTRSIIF